MFIVQINIKTTVSLMFNRYGINTSKVDSTAQYEGVATQELLKSV